MFDKKNTMILTIVAVATLLVAVVGASFAYFTTGIGGSSNTTATVTTASPGSIIIDGGDETLTLKLSVADMMSVNTGKYYALNKTDASGKETEESIHGGKNVVKSYPIATASITNGGSDVTYSCGYTVTITPTAEISDFTGLNLVLNGPGIDTTTIDLSSLSAATSKNGTFSLEGPDGSSEISAGLYLENKNDAGAQNTIAGKTANITIAITGNECTLMAVD